MKKNIYISSPGDKTIKVLEFDKYNIRIIQEVLIGEQAQPIAIYKKHNLLYVGVRPTPKIITYKILENGKLKQLSQLLVYKPLNYIFIDKKNNLLLCSSYHGSLLNVVQLDHYNIPFSIINTFKNIPGCHCTKFNYLHNIILSTSLKSNSIHLFKTKKENLSSNKKFICILKKQNSGPRHFVFHPNNNFIFCINELNNTIDVWKLKTNELKITHVQNVKLIKQQYKKNSISWGSDIQVTACGKYLYASERTNSIITLFTINQNDFKIYFKKSYYVEMQPRSFHIDDTSNYLSVVGEKSNYITIYKISLENGLLHPITRSYAGENPTWIHMN